MVGNLEEKNPQVTLQRVEEIFPDIFKKGTVHVAEVKKPGKTGSLTTTIIQKHSSAVKTELRDNLVLEAIAANRNRLVYNPHICPACNIIFKNKGRLMMHLEVHIISKKLGRTVAETKKKSALGPYNANSKGRQYACIFCDEIYMSEPDLKDHKKTTHFKEKYGCPECELTFKTAIYLNIHIESVHSFNNRRKNLSAKKPALQSQSVKQK